VVEPLITFPGMAEAEMPDHVPADRVISWDVYGLPAKGAIDYAMAYKDLQDAGRLPDIFWTPLNGGHWVGTRSDIIERVLDDHESFSSRYPTVPAQRNMEPRLLPVQADPPEWQKYRIFFNRALSPKQVQTLASAARATAIELIDGFKDRGHCEFVGEFAYHLPVRIFMQIAGLPSDHRLKLLDLVHRIMRGRDLAELEKVRGELGAYALATIRERRANPGTDAISEMATALVDGEPIPEPTLVGMTVLMLLAGLDTVAGMMGFFMWHLALNPQHRRALVDDPAKIPGAVEELLRRYAISTQTRTLRKDAEYDGMQLKTGDLIVAPTALYNLDERIIADPRKVDLERKVRNATFGGGVHRCAGANLARAELRILIEEWLPRIPDFELDPGGKPVIAGAAVAVLAELPLTWRPRS